MNFSSRCLFLIYDGHDLLPRPGYLRVFMNSSTFPKSPLWVTSS